MNEKSDGQALKLVYSSTPVYVEPPSPICRGVGVTLKTLSWEWFGYMYLLEEHSINKN